MDNQQMRAGRLLKQANQLKRKGKLDQAIALYRQAFEINPNFAWAYHNLGDALAKKDSWDEASSFYQKAVKINPNLASSFIMLGKTLVKQKLLDQAISCFQKAIDINCSYYKIYDYLGDIWFEKQNWRLAIECFQKSIEQQPNSYWAYYHLAKALSKQEKFQEAEKYYREAHKLNPRLFLGFNFTTNSFNEQVIPCQIEILESLPYSSEDTRERILGFALDRPQTGEKISSYGLILEGWVVGHNFDVVALEVVDKDSIVIRQSPINVGRSDIAKLYQNPVAEKSGFRMIVDMSVLSESSELGLRTVHSDQKRVLFQLIKYKVNKFHQMVNVNSLTSLANYYKSDKGNSILNSHHYTRIYETELSIFRKKNIAILEIGIQHLDYQNQGLKEHIKAPSLKMWSKYFPEALVIGFDKENFSFVKEERIRIYQGDQGDREDLEKLAQDFPNGFDIIIDDGSHASHHQQTSLAVLFKYLKVGGVYVIEDLHSQPSNIELPGYLKTRDFLKCLYQKKQVFSLSMSDEELLYLANHVKSINFYDSLSTIDNFPSEAIAFIWKK
jgi:Tfp pilus assembly protein PilF